MLSEYKPLRAFSRCDFADVGTENLNAGVLALIFQELQQRDGDGIHFLAAGAAGNPNANRIAILAVRHNLREYRFLQGVKCFRIAKELGDVDQNVFIERLQLARVRTQLGYIRVQAVRAPQRHAAKNPAADGVGFVLREIHAGGLP